MCGIIAYVGANCTENILNGLKQLQNRGYDSLGISKVVDKKFKTYKYASTTTQNAIDTGYPKFMGANEEHIRLFVKQNNSEGFAAIGFNLAHKKDLVANRKPFQIAYCIDENEWNGELCLQLRLKDIQ